MSNTKYTLYVIPLLGCLIFVTTLSAICPQLTAADRVNFGREVRPILSDKCFRCHGPDDDAREADLRLDVRNAALDSGVLSPGSLDDSELWQRVASDDPDTVMPPPSVEKPLTESEKSVLAEWITQGADYEEHWAFAPPVRPAVPQIRSGTKSKPSRREEGPGGGQPTVATWPLNPIDAFVLQRMRDQDLEPSPVADPNTLVRRLYIDLLGLPPSPQQIEQFASELSEDSYRKLVQQLLDSQHFGERWARWWLDAARYADSDGYEKDKPRSVWFYRDWVIRAMNDNLPYDQFVIEQIAGDLLPDATQSQRVATGFLRNSMVNEEGGADPEQFRVEGMFDRMDAVGKAILGITTQCAQCHTHKYDPLSQREYYQMFAALNDFHEATLTVFTSDQANQREAVLDEIRDIEGQIKREMPDWPQQLEAWIDQSRQSLVAWRILTPTDLPFEGQKFRVLGDGSILSESYAPTRTTNTFSLTTRADQITAFRIDALTHPQLPRGGPGRSIYGTGALSEFEVSVAPAERPQEKKTIELRSALSDANPSRSTLPEIYRDRDPAKDDRVTGPVEYAIDKDPKTAWSTDVGPGRRNQDRHAIFIPAEPVHSTGDVILSFTLKQNHGGWNSDDNQNYLLGRYRFSVTDQPPPQRALPPNIERILLKSEADWTANDRDALFSQWVLTDEQFESQAERIEAAWSKFPETDSQLVVESLPKPRDTYVLTRGDFLAPAEAVEPGAPAFLGGDVSNREPARLEFARWLVRPDAPTTARVVINRLWQAYFGRGLVTTPEDFGYQSKPPSHPDLLDWLAVELIESGWNLKHIHRLIVSSATYRQSSAITTSTAERDPENEWLSRGPRFRVNAEIVRDIALSVSGLLNPQIGGPSVYPPAPAFLFQPPASYGPKVWDTANDEQQYRRSLYVHAYRSVPYPALQVFDAPKGDAACIRRERSNTPLQALVLLNEPQFFECARAMASRVLREAPTHSDIQRLKYAHALATGRNPSAEELRILARLLEQQRERVAADELDASAILGVAPTTLKQLTGWQADDVIPWIVVCRALLNLDETITKQ